MGTGRAPAPFGSQYGSSAYEKPSHDHETHDEKHERHPDAQRQAHVGYAVEAPAKTAHEINDGIEQRHLLPNRRQHPDGVEAAAEKRERRHDQHRDELELLEPVRPKADDEPEQAERDR